MPQWGCLPWYDVRPGLFSGDVLEGSKKASGLAWLIVLDAVERLYGDKNVIGSVGRESKPDGAR